MEERWYNGRFGTTERAVLDFAQRVRAMIQPG